MTDLKHYEAILSPVITEKSTAASEHKQSGWKVTLTATKARTKAAVAGLFKVKVKAVNTITTKGKVKRFKGFVSKRTDVKKAVVTLAEGQSIDVATGL